jgi:L-lactate utilization protein LutC
MTGSREHFLERVRRAVTEGNRTGGAAPLPERSGVGYQGAGPDPIARFRAELTAAGGHTHLVPDRAAAVGTVLSLVQARAARRVLVGQGDWLDSLGLTDALRGAGVEALTVAGRPPRERREEFFGADVGITGVDYLVAETGSLALLSRPGQPRSLSLLPPCHVAVASAGQVVPDLFDLFGALLRPEGGGLPSCLSLITGPSKTGDIELRLVTGVHGPGEVHVVLVEAPGTTVAGAEARPRHG